MEARDVPQENNATLGGHRKAVYARDANHHLALVPSRGWEPEEIVTRQAVEAFEHFAAAARERVKSGLCSPLEYHMYRARMDIALLAQTSGMWRWRVRRHLRPDIFARLPLAIKARYAAVLGIKVEALDGVA
jgi:hypothetical protein